MNWAIWMVVIPALLVAAGYVVVLRSMGFAPGYPRLIVALLALAGAIWWLSGSGRRKRSSRQNQV